MRPPHAELACVVNLSEGRDWRVLASLAAMAGPALLDLHADASHHRAVCTLAGPADVVQAAARALCAAAIARLDLTDHAGVHPRIGVVDVVPFVAPPHRPGPVGHAAVAARDQFATWAGTELALPCFLYGPLPAGGVHGPLPAGGAAPDGTERTLPEVRRRAFVDLAPDTGPPRPHPTAGACAVGARPVLVAYNVWLARGDLALARSVAAAVRGPGLRALGLDVGGRRQVSCNLVDPFRLGPVQAFDAIAAAVAQAGGAVAGGELVGLVPAAVLAAAPESRWAEVGLRANATIEGRLADPPAVAALISAARQPGRRAP